MNMKNCTVCKVEKLLIEFGKYATSKDGLHYRCKYCDKVKNTAWLAAHPFRNCWRHMLGRCYSTKNKSYHNYGARGCWVVDSWRNKKTGYEVYRDFRLSLGDFMGSKMDLDKDIKVPGNLCYGPEFCILVSKSDNQKAKRNRAVIQSIHPFVYWNKQRQKWQARLKINGKDKHIGWFINDTEAHQAILAERQAMGMPREEAERHALGG